MSAQDAVRLDDNICIPNDHPGKADGAAANTAADVRSGCTGKQNDIMGIQAGMVGLLMKDIVGHPNDIVDMEDDVLCSDVLAPGSPSKDEGAYQLNLTGHVNNVHSHTSERAMVLSPNRSRRRNGPRKLFAILRAIFQFFPVSPFACTGFAMLPGCSNYASSAGGARVLTGTLFGQRKGHVHFAVQDNPNAPPFLLLELATPTNTLVKEMASGLVRIALECERTQNRGRLLLEKVWTMYCNGRKTGYAIRRACSEGDLQVFQLVKAVSMGAGVLPIREEGPDGELMYMRARFERVVGSRDSEAFYMLNPDGSGGPDLSIFLLRI